MENPFNKIRKVAVMLVKEGHCVERLQNITTSTKSSFTTGLPKTTDTHFGQVLLWMLSL